MTVTVQLAFLLAIPAIAFVFLTQKTHIAAAASMVFGCLLLPAARGFDLPLIPLVDQNVLPSLMCFVMICALSWPLLIRAKIGQGPEVLILVLILASFVTNLTNTDPQVFGSRVLSAMQPTDTINDTLRFLIRWALPFVIGRAVTRSADDLREVLTIVVLGGLMYLPFAVIEHMTGPNWHKWVYGAHPFPFTFSQQVKFGGYRPVVFMTHGLNYAMFMLFAASAALILTKVKHKLFGFPIFPVTLALIVMLVPARTVGVWVYALIALPLIALAKPKLQVLVAVLMAVAVLGYPTLRASGGMPVEEMHAFTLENVGEKAAHSLFGRLRTEEEIMERTRQRFIFGWGSYGRYQIFDPFTGESLSTLDGFWVATIGEGGAVRLALMLSFLLLPVFSAYRNMGRVKTDAARRLIGGVALIMAVRAVDMIPNSGVEAYLTFLCGSLHGAIRGEVRRRIPARESQTAEVIPEEVSGQPGAGTTPGWAEERVPAASSGPASLGMLASQGPPIRSRSPRDAFPKNDEDDSEEDPS